MKKIIYTLVFIVAISLSSCFDVVNETNINDNGTGIFISTSDLSPMFAMMKMMGGEYGDSLDEMNNDSLIYLSSYKDSIPGLTDAEISLIEKATLRLVLNAPEEKFQMIFSFPYSKLSDINVIGAILKRLKNKSFNDAMGNLQSGEDAAADPFQMGELDFKNSDPEDYFDYSFENGKISKKLNKEKYSLVESDEGLKLLREMSNMGSPMNIVTVYHLPKPAKKAEGKNLSLSTDKKKITIEVNLDDFFESPDRFEYNIEY